MHSLKIIVGCLSIVLAWAFIFHNKIIFRMNAWMRENVFSDRLVLFSNRRMAILLAFLGVISLFSGIRGIEDLLRIKPHLAAEIFDQAQEEFKKKAYMPSIQRCKELIKSDPHNIRAWELLAQSWLALGRKDMAKQSVQMLVHHNPTYSIEKSPLRLVLQEKNKKP